MIDRLADHSKLLPAKDKKRKIYEDEIKQLNVIYKTKQNEDLIRDAKAYMNSIGTSIRAISVGRNQIINQIFFNTVPGYFNSIKEMTKLNNGSYQLTTQHADVVSKFLIPESLVQNFANQHRLIQQSMNE